MPSTICTNCGRLTNSAVSNYWFPDEPDGGSKDPEVATKCYVALVDNVWVKGCYYDSLSPDLLKHVAGLLGKKRNIHKPS